MLRSTCLTPGCKNFAKRRGVDPFCSPCREEHSLFVLRLQVEHGKLIREIISDAKIFQTAQGMADYLGVSFVTLYNWIDKYFNMTFQEFKRRYICRSSRCYLLDLKRSSYTRSDYILKMIRNSGRCACVNALEPNVIMTNAPHEFISRTLRGAPKLIQVSDMSFALAPKPIKIKKVYPIRISEISDSV